MKKLLISLFVACGFALQAAPAAASEGGYRWDSFPQEKMTDMAALQNGARIFVNYCLNCHSAQYMRFNRLQDIGLTEDEIKKNLLVATDKVGDTMKTTLDRSRPRTGFGAAPPDLSRGRARRAPRSARAAAPTTCTPCGAPSTATTTSRPAGTTSPSPTSACRTPCGSCRASAAPSSPR